MDILKKIFFVLLLLGLVGGEILRFDTGQSIAITFFDISTILFVGGSLVLNFFQRKQLIITKAQKFALWFVGIGLVSLLLQIPQLGLYPTFVALLYAVRFIIYTVGIAWSVQLFNEDFKKKIPYFLFGGSTILAGLGVVQFTLYPSLRNLFYAGWDPHLYRVFSTFLDPNFMGLLYVLGIILGVSLLLHSPPTTKIKKFLIVFFIVLECIVLFLTYSRGAYIAGAVGAGVLLWRAGLQKTIIKYIVLGIIFVVLLEIFGHHSEGTKLLRTASVRDRMISLSQVTTIISHHPFLGVGFDAYRYAQEKEGFLTKKVNTTHSGAGTDNSFLFVLATTGIAGFVAYLLMTWNILKVSYLQKTLEGHTLFASYLALIIGSFFVNALFYPFLLVWVWILIGL